MSLRYIKNKIQECRKCPLSQERHLPIPGEIIANVHPTIMVVGETPGVQEDLQGKPFVGRPGGIIRDLIKDLEMDPKQIFLTYLIKCKPRNRKPTKQEIQSCMSFLHAEIWTIQPKVIVTLGQGVSNALAATDADFVADAGNDTIPLYLLRQLDLKYVFPKTKQTFHVIPTWNPSYIARKLDQGDYNPIKEAKKDFQKVKFLSHDGS